MFPLLSPYYLPTSLPTTIGLQPAWLLDSGVHPLRPLLEEAALKNNALVRRVKPRA